MAATLLGTVAAGGYVVGNIGINTDTTDMLSAELPFRQADIEITNAFPQFSKNILIVVDGPSPDLVNAAADLLTARLSGATDLFGFVYDPAGEDFFQQNGLLYQNLDDLYALSDRLALAQPMLGVLWNDPSLVGLFGVLELAIDNGLNGGGAADLNMDFVFDAMAGVVEAQARGAPDRLSWSRLMMGADSSALAGQRFIITQPVLDFESLAPAGHAIDEVRRLAVELDLAGRYGARVRLSGDAALAHEELKSVQQGLGLAGVLSAILVTLLLGVGLRAPSLVVATFITLVAGLVWTAAFATAAVGTLNLISVAFAVLFVGLSVDFGIHFGLRYKEGIDRGDGNGAALAQAAEGVGGALTLSAVAAMIGFFSFMPTSYVGLAELGLIAGAGMFIALAANLTVLPAMLTLWTPGPSPPHLGALGTRKASAFIARHARPIVIGAVGLGLAAAVLLPDVRFDFDPLHLKDEGTESVQVIHELLGDEQVNPYNIQILATELESAKALAAQLAPLGSVDKVVTLASYVPEDQGEKLEVIESTALFLAPSFAAPGRAPPPGDEARGKALNHFHERISTLATMMGGESPVARLATALDGLKSARGFGPEVTSDLDQRLLSTLAPRLKSLRHALGARAVDESDLPPSLAARMVAADGRARIEVYPKEDLRQRASLRRFVEEVRTVAPGAIGAPVIIEAAGEAVVSAFIQAAAIAVVLISILLFTLLRRTSDVLLVFAPLTLAALLTVAASVLFGLPFNFANVIVLPLLFGLGVASGIHLVLRERTERGANDVMLTSTPRAVMFSALTTIGSFGSIALSGHPGTSSMGTLLTIAITLTLISTLVVLPALMALRSKSAP